MFCACFHALSASDLEHSDDHCKRRITRVIRVQMTLLFCLASLGIGYMIHLLHRYGSNSKRLLPTFPTIAAPSFQHLRPYIDLVRLIPILAITIHLILMIPLLSSRLFLSILLLCFSPPFLQLFICGFCLHLRNRASHFRLLLLFPPPVSLVCGVVLSH